MGRFGFVVLSLAFSGVCATMLAHDLREPDFAPVHKLPKTQGSTEADTIRCSLVDRAGSLWFGSTGEGVYRYDGNGFTQFTIHDGLASNTVWSIMEDSKGRIWIGTDSGLSRWDGERIGPIPIPPSAETSESAAPSSDQTPAEQPAVWSLFEDSRGTIWVGTDGGMFRGRDDAFTPFLDDVNVRNEDRLQLKMVESVLEDRRGTIWFASGMPPGMEGLCRFDGVSLTRFNPGGEKWIRTVLEDRDGSLWLGTRTKGAWRFDGEAFSRVTDPPGIGIPRLVDRAGNVWFGGGGRATGLESETGIWRYDGKTFRNFSASDRLGMVARRARCGASLTTATATSGWGRGTPASTATTGRRLSASPTEPIAAFVSLNWGRP